MKKIFIILTIYYIAKFKSFLLRNLFILKNFLRFKINICYFVKQIIFKFIIRKLLRIFYNEFILINKIFLFFEIKLFFIFQKILALGLLHCY